MLRDDNELDNHVVVDWEEYKAIERAHYLTGPHTTTKEQYQDMLECLPPFNWSRSGVIESFIMSEFTTGTITNQFAKMGGHCISQAIDYSDKSTWINEDSFRLAAANDAANQTGVNSHRISGG
ncbi:MAG: DUF1419 domain-containing protein [Candidatus Sabulitectum sp.]|nr:DUF1419 domain-containing protein [Candidatus Sabulitectum sp.]